MKDFSQQPSTIKNLAIVATISVLTEDFTSTPIETSEGATLEEVKESLEKNNIFDCLLVCSNVTHNLNIEESSIKNTVSVNMRGNDFAFVSLFRNLYKQNPEQFFALFRILQDVLLEEKITSQSSSS